MICMLQHCECLYCNGKLITAIAVAIMRQLSRFPWWVWMIRLGQLFVCVSDLLIALMINRYDNACSYHRDD